MDWSKAKTILIIAFLITNLLLGYVLFVSERPMEATLKEEFINEVIELLARKDIQVETEIPRVIPKLHSLNVEYEGVDIKTLNKQYFDGNGTILVRGEGLLEIIDEDRNLALINNKLLIYEDKNPSLSYKDLKQEEAIEIAKDFLEDKDYDISDLELSFIKKEENIYYIEFSKVYEGNYLESAFTNFQIGEKGIKKVERLWLNPAGTGELPIYINTAPKSILGLLSMEGVYGKTITDISLCYYFNPGKHEYIKDPKDAKQGRAIPAWRVQFKDGYKIIIDDYNY